MASIAKTVDASAGKPSAIMQYVIGFLCAVILTLAAYGVVVGHWLTGGAVIAVIMGLAVVQLVVQLFFFLHLGKGKNRRWNVAAFLFMILILVIVVAGSLWIMYSLNYNMQMTPEQMDRYMKEQGSKGF